MDLRCCLRCRAPHPVQQSVGSDPSVRSSWVCSHPPGAPKQGHHLPHLVHSSSPGSPKGKGKGVCKGFSCHSYVYLKPRSQGAGEKPQKQNDSQLTTVLEEIVNVAAVMKNHLGMAGNSLHKGLTHKDEDLCSVTRTHMNSWA